MSHDFGHPSGDAAARVPDHGVPRQPYDQQYQNNPSYGYGPPGSAAFQSPPSTLKIKPGIGWIVGAWLIAALSVVVGIGGFVSGIFSAFGDAAPTSSFGSGETVTVTLGPADGSVIYVSATEVTRFECGLQDGPGKSSLERPDAQQAQQIVTSDGVVWEMGLRVGVDRAGDYRLTCTTDEASGTRFGMGKELVADSLVGGVIALFAVPGAGILLAIIVTIVVLVKRSGARRRRDFTSAEQWGPWPQGPHGR
jgi:hypothetical protein